MHIIPTLIIATTLRGGLSITNDIGIIGARVSAISHKIMFCRKGSPAEEWLLPGDKIMGVDGIAKSMHIDGAVGTKVILSIKRGELSFELPLVRVSALSLGLDPEMYHE
jgi:C-terminal processing protease CtpA/Prc